jgi:hypothetical protein
MYLFSRTSVANRSRFNDAAAFAIDITETVRSVTGMEVTCWTVLYGAPLGTVVWTAPVESHAAMGAASEKLLAHAGYRETVEAAADLWDGNAEDQIVDMVAMVGDGGHTGEYASLVQAQCAGGHAGEAMAWGVEILDHVGGLTGRDGVFGRTMYGPWGGVGWITLANSLDEIDAANAAMAADPGYVERVDGAGDLFLEGATSSRLSRRIA